MPANASIGEPFSLSTYNSRFPKASSSKKEANFTPVFASHTKAHGSADGYATVTAQSDGIHVLDIADLHPVLSHTLGPTTTFCCPAISFCEVEAADQYCTTFAGIETTSDLSAEERGKTIWTWRESLSSQLSERSFQKKKAVSVPHRVFALDRCDELPSTIIVSSPTGEVSTIDKSLKIASAWTPKDTSASVLRVFAISKQTCTFSLPSTSPSKGAIVVTLAQSEPEKSLHVQVLAVSEQSAISELGSIALANETDVADCSFNSSGYLTVLSKAGIWHSYLLETSEQDKPTFTPVADPFRLKGLSFLKKSKHSEDVSLLATTASHVLLSALTETATPEIVLHLWDLQYSVLLASQVVPLPSGVSEYKNSSIRMTLVEATSTHAILTLCPTAAGEQKTPRSTVFIIPFTCPSTSTIASALGQAAASEKWIDSGASPAEVVAKETSYDTARAKVVAAMQAAMDKNLPQSANKAFFDWEARESKAAAKNASASGSLESDEVKLGETFVKDVLFTVLQPSKPANTPYSSEVTRHLLNRKVVSSAMLDGGLLIALRAKDDWLSISLAMSKVVDLSELEILDSLRVVVLHHRQTSTSDDNAMEVDSTSGIPSLPAFLALCVNYTTSAGPLRRVLKRLFPDPEDVLVILKVLDSWLDRWLQDEENLLPSQDQVSKNEKGISIIQEDVTVNPELPPLQKILGFLQILLDATFLILLAHPPAQNVLRSIQSHIDPQIANNTTLEQLRGPLEGYANAQTKAIKEASEDKKNKQPVGDWRQRRKRLHEQAGLAIGLYQVEELVL